MPGSGSASSRDAKELLASLERALATLELGREGRQSCNLPIIFLPHRPNCQRYPGGGAPKPARLWDTQGRAHANGAGPGTIQEDPKTLDGGGRPPHDEPTKSPYPDGVGQTIQQTILPGELSREGTITVTCVHGDSMEIPAAEVQIQGKAGTWPLLVGVIPDLPVPLLLGRDWPGFPASPAPKSSRAPQHTKETRGLLGARRAGCHSRR